MNRVDEGHTMKKQNLIAILTLVALAASVDHARAVLLAPGSPTYQYDAC